MHTPVLLQKAIENLNVITGGKYIDATYGEGGYSEAIVKHGGNVLALDLDVNQLKSSRVNELSNLKLIQGNFKDIARIAKENDYCPVDGVVFDLGLSMRQLNSLGRGFSYKKPEEPLDMRLSLENELTAKDIIKKSNEIELYEILAKNSEEIRAKEIAAMIKSKRKMDVVYDLTEAIDRAVGYKSSSVYARIFQALRIKVNDEFENLKQGFAGAVEIIKKEGRIVVVSFHSLEDRIVKNFAKENQLSFLTIL